MRVTGHLWPGRFGPVVRDEAPLAHAVHDVSLNPVRARRVERAQDGPWSSVLAHLCGNDGERVRVAPVPERYGDFAVFLDRQEDMAEAFRALRQSETTGRPLGTDPWIEWLEKPIGRQLKPQKRGPKRKERQARNWLI
jgi:putative transposase